MSFRLWGAIGGRSPQRVSTHSPLSSKILTDSEAQEALNDGVRVRVGVQVGLAVRAKVGVSVAVGLCVGVKEAVAVGVPVGRRVPVDVGVEEGVAVAVRDGVAANV